MTFFFFPQGLIDDIRMNFIMLIFFIYYYSLFRTISKLLKSTLKPSESPSITTKLPLQLPTIQPRPSLINTMTRSMTISNNDVPHTTNSDSINETFQTKTSMSTSLYSPMINNEQLNHSTESISTPRPQAPARTGKVALGARVLPLDSNGAPPHPKSRSFAEKKGRKIFSFPCY